VPEIRDYRAPAPEFFGRPIEPVPAGVDTLEIGCGVGWHAITMAQRHPDWQILAVERTHEKYRKFSDRLDRHRASGVTLDNLHARNVDFAVLQNLYPLQPGSLKRVFILYPNPYPKPKHLNKRWYAMPFLQVIVDLMQDGATLNLATNIKDYAEGCCLAFPEVGLELTSQRVLGIVDVEHARTHFEKKYLSDSQPCYDLVFEKTKGKFGY